MSYEIVFRNIKSLVFPGLPTQRVQRGCIFPFVQESAARVGRSLRQIGTRIVYVDIQGLHGRVSVNFHL